MIRALIIFVRNPVPGTVKTRLAETIGDERALQIYKLMLAYTTAISSDLRCDKFVYYADFINDSDGWDNELYKKRLQQGNDLGARMKAAFNEILKAGFQHAVIIGSDCFELTGALVETAFKQLERADCVIGPSEDGGYYLLGLKTMYEKLFEDKPWSSSGVYVKTIGDLHAAGLSYSILPTLKDIDVEADLPLEFR